LPLLTSSNPQLGATGAVVTVREVQKGSFGSGNRLWVSFDPPTSDNGNPISGYGINWDTSNAFTAAPQRYVIQDPILLYYRQKVISLAPSLAWSRTLLPTSSTVQSISVGVNAFTLAFNGAATPTITAGITSLAQVQTWLSSLPTINGGVTVSPVVGLVTAGTSVAVTFSGQFGPLPLLVSSEALTTVGLVTTGVTNYRKEVLAFSCAGTAGTIQITVNGLSRTFNFNQLLSEVEAGLETMVGASAGSITVTTTSQAFMCVAVATPPQVVTITFHRTYGALGSAVTGTGGAVITASPTSTAGIYVTSTAAMSGTFRLAFQGATTPPLNSQMAAMDLRV
ncbi:hypothetical protein As57867_005433, partial [Aphanomyces stellatus]